MNELSILSIYKDDIRESFMESDACDGFEITDEEFEKIAKVVKEELSKKLHIEGEFLNTVNYCIRKGFWDILEEKVEAFFENDENFEKE